MNAGCVRENGMKSGAQHQMSKRTELENHPIFLANCVGSHIPVHILRHSSALFFSPAAPQCLRTRPTTPEVVRIHLYAFRIALSTY